MLMRLISYFLLGTLLVSCESVQLKEKFTRLEDSLTRYASAIRWARYLDAYDYHYGKDGIRPKLRIEKFQGIEVTGYEVIEKTANAEQNEVFVVAIISYYNKNVGTVNEFKHLQTWWYKEDTRAWLLDANLPDLK